MLVPYVRGYGKVFIIDHSFQHLRQSSKFQISGSWNSRACWRQIDGGEIFDKTGCIITNQNILPCLNVGNTRFLLQQWFFISIMIRTENFTVKPWKRELINKHQQGMIHVWRPWKLSKFQDRLTSYSIYVRICSTPLNLDV